jgi:hypothetical protein
MRNLLRCSFPFRMACVPEHRKSAREHCRPMFNPDRRARSLLPLANRARGCTGRVDHDGGPLRLRGRSGVRNLVAPHDHPGTVLAHRRCNSPRLRLGTEISRSRRVRGPSAIYVLPGIRCLRVPLVQHLSRRAQPSTRAWPGAPRTWELATAHRLQRAGAPAWATPGAARLSAPAMGPKPWATSAFRSRLRRTEKLGAPAVSLSAEPRADFFGRSRGRGNFGG